MARYRYMYFTIADPYKDLVPEEREPLKFLFEHGFLGYEHPTEHFSFGPVYEYEGHVVELVIQEHAYVPPHTEELTKYSKEMTKKISKFSRLAKLEITNENILPSMKGFDLPELRELTICDQKITKIEGLDKSTK
ncbi:MAG: hypothetical protein ACFFDN_09780 [Candidatus Hodarchaeota archaeon]